MRKRPYREGDVIKILDDTKFIKRVGYNLAWQDVFEKIFVKNPAIDSPIAMLTTTPSSIEQSMRDLGLNYRNHAQRRFFCKGVAMAYVGQQKFGGNERKIFYQNDEGQALTRILRSFDEPVHSYDFETVVTGKRVVKTGTYYPPFFGEDHDYDPGGLDKMKTHVLLDTPYGEISTEHVEFVREGK